jgi:hypothetical protein
VPAICAAVVLSVSGAYAVRGAGAPEAARCAPLVQHHAPMATYRTTYLREEINRHRGGEDSRTTIERNCERRQDIEGHNLERDFDLHASAGAPSYNACYRHALRRYHQRFMRSREL